VAQAKCITERTIGHHRPEFFAGHGGRREKWNFSHAGEASRFPSIKGGESRFIQFIQWITGFGGGFGADTAEL
jgi:hypothetical protein